MADTDYRTFLAAGRFEQPVIALYGNDYNVVDGAAHQVLQYYKRGLAAECTVTTVPYSDVANEPDIIIDFFGAPSLFGGARALHVAALTEKSLTLLKAFFDQASTTSATTDLLLFSSDSIKRKSKTLDLFRSHSFASVLSAYETALDRSSVRQKAEAAGCGPLDDDAIALLLRASLDLTPAMFDTLLEKISLSVPTSAPVRETDIRDCLPLGADRDDNDTLEALLAGSRPALLARLHFHLDHGGEPIAFAAQLGRQLGDLLSKQRSTTRTGPSLFWKTAKALQKASARLTRIDARLEQALIEIHRFDQRSRQTGALAATELERTLLRICRLFEG